MSLSPVEIALLTGRWDPQIPTLLSPATELAHAVVQCRFKDALTSDTARAIIVPGTGPTLADAFSITSTETEEDDLARVVLAAACLQAFVQANWTGPDLDIAPLDLLANSPGAWTADSLHATVQKISASIFPTQSKIRSRRVVFTPRSSKRSATNSGLAPTHERTVNGHRRAASFQS